MQKSFAVKSYTLHLNRSASDPSCGARLNCKKVCALNALISPAGLKRRSSHHEGKEGEQHAEDLGLVDALTGGTFAERINCKNGGLLNELNAKSGSRCTTERINCK